LVKQKLNKFKVLEQELRLGLLVAAQRLAQFPYQLMPMKVVNQEKLQEIQQERLIMLLSK
jgi:hypothetical protein